MDEHRAVKRYLKIFTLLAFWTAASPASVFVVTKETDDNGPCTPDDCALREAVLAANALPGPDVVEIPGGTYQLSLVGPVPENLSQTGDLDIHGALEIRGDAFNPVTIVGDGTDRIIEILTFDPVEISHITVTGGAALSSGGGIRASGLSFFLRDSTIVGNTTQFGDGGGLLLGAVRSATVENCTIAANSAPLGGGGGVYVIAVDDLSLVNTTVSANSARSGGGIYVFGSGRFNLINLSIADNTSQHVFGEGVVGDLIPFNSLRISNTLIANNNCGYISAIPVTNGHNMEGPTATCFSVLDGDQIGVPDVMLGPLADNGGPTQTHALLPGSLALDAALDADCPNHDQRGYFRPTDGNGDSMARCDIGAYEANSAPPAVIPTLDRLGLVALVLLIVGAGFLRLLSRSKGS